MKSSVSIFLLRITVLVSHQRNCLLITEFSPVFFWKFWSLLLGLRQRSMLSRFFKYGDSVA